MSAHWKPTGRSIHVSTPCEGRGGDSELWQNVSDRSPAHFALIPLLTRRQMVSGSLAAVASSLFPGCGSKSLSSPGSSDSLDTLSANPQPAPSTSITSASLTVTNTSAGTIPSQFLGFSLEKSTVSGNSFSSTNSDLIALYNMLGQNVIRIGGSSVDASIWTPNGAGKVSGQIAPSDVDRLNDFLNATGYKCIYDVNFAGTNSTPALAAAEAKYVYDTLGSSLLSIEIGNEPDLYGNSSSYFAGNWSLAQFEARWEQYRSAILAAESNIPISGPADGSAVSTWTVPFGQYATSSQINLLTQHYYRFTSASGTPTAAGLIAEPDSTLTSLLATLKSGAQGIGIPFRIAECNSVSRGGQDGVSNVYAATLWAIDFLFNCAQGGSIGVNFHGGGSATGYAPIAMSNGRVVSVQPLFYGMYFFSKVGAGTLCSSAFSGNSYTTAYAVKGSYLQIVVVNKDSTNNLNLTINLPNSVRYATLTQLVQLSSGATAPNLSATDGITIQGASIGIDGTFSPNAVYTLTPGSTQLTCYVPALSAVLIKVV